MNDTADYLLQCGAVPLSASSIPLEALLGTVALEFRPLEVKMATTTRRHQNDTKTFEELTTKEQALSINAHTV